MTGSLRTSTAEANAKNGKVRYVNIKMILLLTVMITWHIEVASGASCAQPNQVVPKMVPPVLIVARTIIENMIVLRTKFRVPTFSVLPNYTPSYMLQLRIWYYQECY
jgi:hypothetical protein